MKSSDIHIRAISQKMLQPLITKIHLKTAYLKFHSNFPGANELKLFIHILEGCFTGTGAIVTLPQGQSLHCPSASEVILKNTTKIGQNTNTTKTNQNIKTEPLILGMYSGNHGNRATHATHGQATLKHQEFLNERHHRKTRNRRVT